MNTFKVLEEHGYDAWNCKDRKLRTTIFQLAAAEEALGYLMKELLSQKEISNEELSECEERCKIHDEDWMMCKMLHDFLWNSLDLFCRKNHWK